MRNSKDHYQRKVYAVMRMSWATARLRKGRTQEEKEKAAFWVTAWASISGLRQFKIERNERKKGM
jgi:hypothetical protein